MGYDFDNNGISMSRPFQGDVGFVHAAPAGQATQQLGSEGPAQRFRMKKVWTMDL